MNPILPSFMKGDKGGVGVGGGDFHKFAQNRGECFGRNGGDMLALESERVLKFFTWIHM